MKYSTKLLWITMMVMHGVLEMNANYFYQVKVLPTSLEDGENVRNLPKFACAAYTVEIGKKL